MRVLTMRAGWSRHGDDRRPGRDEGVARDPARERLHPGDGAARAVRSHRHASLPDPGRRQLLSPLPSDAGAAGRGAGVRRPLVSPGAAPSRCSPRRRSAWLGSAPPGSVVRAASCLGRCDRAPACAVNDVIVSARDAPTRSWTPWPRPPPASPIRADAVVRDPRTLDVDPYGAGERYAAARKLAASGDTNAPDRQPQGQRAARHGRRRLPHRPQVGDRAQRSRASPKYIVCNADETSPAPSRTAIILENVPHLLVRGHAARRPGDGRRQGIVYVRHEYEAQIEIVEHEIATARARPGCSAPTSSAPAAPSSWRPSSAPAATSAARRRRCSEALEGKRAEPRNKPPFPGRRDGLHGKPTVDQQRRDLRDRVRSILAARPRVVEGAGARTARPALKFVGVSGDVARPGVYEIADGHCRRARSSIDRAGGVAAAGRSRRERRRDRPPASCRASLLDTAARFRTRWPPRARCSARARSLVLRRSAPACSTWRSTPCRFFRNESCGKCVPCRVGSAKLVEVLGQIARGEGRAAAPRP